MGRQAAAVLTDDQEHLLLSHLRKSADVVLVRAAALEPAEVFCQHFVPRGDWSWMYYLWNRSFPWAPELEQYDTHVVVGNTESAPLIEYTRHNFAGVEPAGRIYWGKGFAAPDGLAYDSAAFERWYLSVAQWVRRHGRAP